MKHKSVGYNNFIYILQENLFMCTQDIILRRTVDLNDKYVT